MSTTSESDFDDHETLEGLLGSLFSTHQEFLKEDEPVKKSEALQLVSKYAKKFLDLVILDEKKFLFKQTGAVLKNSLMNVNNFTPREASVAFEHLAKYAHNLMYQPWRTDFHTLRLTSGFFVHNISSQLHNAQEILKAMGYDATEDENILKIVPNDMDLDRLKAVSLDMIIASQECIILSQIYKKVSRQEPDYPLTMDEVFEYRSKYPGPSDTVSRILLIDIRRLKQQANLQSSAMDCEEIEIGVDALSKPEKKNEIEVEHDDMDDFRKPKEKRISEPISRGREFADYLYSPSRRFSTNKASTFSPNRKPSSQTPYSADSKSRKSMSNMVPIAASSFYSKDKKKFSYSQVVKSSNSMFREDASLKSNSVNQPLKFSKVAPDAENWNSENVPKLYSQVSATKSTGKRSAIMLVNCPRCTLLNSSDTCEACNFKLKSHD